ncbi:MAG: Trm112 family protein [Janthinobacterium lividum]
MSDDLPVTSPIPGGATAVDRRLLEILVCPVTKGSLTYDAQRQELVSDSAKLAYPIRDGIPIMLPEEARQLDV